MDIIKRNFFRLMRSGAFNDKEALEPMSAFKWRRLFQMVEAQRVVSVFAHGAYNNGYDESLNIPEELLKVIEQFNMTKFLTALSWILANLLGQEREKLLLEPNEDEGRFFLQEVFVSGNFGKSDPQQQKNNGKKNLYSYERLGA